MNNWGRKAATLMVATLGVLPASAQIPWLSGLGESKTPSVRLVGADPLVESAQQLGAKIELRAAERGAALDALKADLLAERRQVEASLEAAVGPEVQEVKGEGASPGLQAEADLQEIRARLAALARLKGALDDERGTLEQAQEVVRSALATARTRVRRTVGTRRLDAALVLKRAARLAEEQAELAEGGIDSDASLLEAGAEPRPDLTELERVRSWLERGGSVAQMLLARARVVELQARERLMEGRLDSLLRALRTRPDELESARASVEEAEQKLAEVTAEMARQPALAPRVRGARFGALRTQLARDHERARKLRVAAAEAVWIRERTRLDVLRYQWAGREAFPVGLAATPITSRLSALRARKAELVEARTSHLAEVKDASLVGEQMTLQKSRTEVLETSLALAASGEGDLQTAIDLVELAQRLEELQTVQAPGWLSWLLTLLAGALIFLLLRVGHRLLLAWERPAHWLTLRLHLGNRGRLRAGLALSLIYTVAIAAAGAWLVLRFVWDMRIDASTVGAAITHPLFVIDDRPVHLGSILQLIVAIVAAVIVSRIVRRFFTERVYPMLDWDTGLTTALSTLFHYTVVVVGFLLGLQFVGIGLSSLALFAGVLGIGIGFGMRNVAENFISGLIILAERPIKIGDYIELEGRYEGRVDDIEARATTVVTRDNVSVIIPNSEFIGSRVTNWSYGDPRVRLRVAVGVAYGSDIDLVRRVLLEVASRHGKVLKRPNPEVWFDDFGASSLDFQLLFWIDDQHARFRIGSDLRFAIDKAFRKYAIEIAFPQVDLHVRDLPPHVVAGLEPGAAAAPPPVPASDGPTESG